MKKFDDNLQRDHRTFWLVKMSDWLRGKNKKEMSKISLSSFDNLQLAPHILYSPIISVMFLLNVNLIIYYHRLIIQSCYHLYLTFYWVFSYFIMISKDSKFFWLQVFACIFSLSILYSCKIPKYISSSFSVLFILWLFSSATLFASPQLPVEFYITAQDESQSTTLISFSLGVTQIVLDRHVMAACARGPSVWAIIQEAGVENIHTLRGR